jgi:hypothetical protein
LSETVLVETSVLAVHDDLVGGTVLVNVESTSVGNILLIGSFPVEGAESRGLGD